MERRGRRGCALKEVSYRNDAVERAERVGTMRERVRIV
jgi:hypothetical protein